MDSTAAWMRITARCVSTAGEHLYAANAGAGRDRFALPVVMISGLGKQRLHAATRPVSRPALHPVFVSRIAYDLHGDLSETVVRIGLRVIRDRIRIAQI